MKKLLVLPMVALSMMSAQAAAQDGDGTGGYVHLRAGFTDLNKPSFVIEDADPNPNTTVEGRVAPRNALTFGGEFGHDFGDVRIGIEASYARHKVRSIDFKMLNGREFGEATLLDTLVDIGYEPEYELDDGEPTEEIIGLDGYDITGTRIRASKGSVARVRQIAVMANLTYEIPVENSPVKPYVGAGVGGTFNQVEALGDKGTKFQFAWQVRGGIAFQAAEKVELTLDYTYRNVGKTKIGQLDDNEVSALLGKTRASIWQAGVRFGF